MRLLTSGPSALLLIASLTLATPAHAASPEPATRAAAAQAITIAVKSDVVLRGKKVVITGAVKGKKISRVSLQQKRPGSKWKTQATAKVKANGTYKLKDKTTKAVTRKYRVVSVTGPKTKSAKVKVGVYEWRDLTKQGVRHRDGWGTSKSATINGVPYSPAFIGYQWNGTTTGLIDFNVARECIQLRARFGIGDNSDLAGRATISVLSDDAPVYSGSFGLTQSEYTTIALGSPFRVGISYTVENTGGSETPPGAIAVAAQPEILCTSAK
ncbi:hypothetical protein [Nocardioides humi]|uniref:NPCBM/NEW2 domain-containing protein n=1 Tax=Nocardioides humi TaxID=449461 RepID=A0ABN2B4U3_9ACTN|nr:hypothetical protein [Nocardioides humi]